jgi:hypothetical protein
VRAGRWKGYAGDTSARAYRAGALQVKGAPLIVIIYKHACARLRGHRFETPGITLSVRLCRLLDEVGNPAAPAVTREVEEDRN